MAYADYAYYTGTWLGNAISQLDFPRLSLRASDFIDYYTRGKAARATEYESELAKACCAIAEQMQKDERADDIATQTTDAAITSGNGEIKSETVGGYSVSYTTSADYASAEKARAQNYIAVARQYLANTGLLYRGC